jgi:hypothetical protein
MKRILVMSVIVVLGMGLLNSCNKLTENPAGSLTTTNFYKTQTDAVAAVTAVYSTLTTDPLNDFPLYGRQLNLLVDNTSDNQVYSPSNTNPDVRALGTATYVPTNGRIQKIYSQLYWGINLANVAIDEIPTIPAGQFLDPTHAQLNLIREARFIRALDYFNLVRLFGPVSLVLHTATTLNLSTLEVGRTSRDSVYQQIITDLDSATSLPSSYTGANIGRVTSGAAYALLAKVYVTIHDWTDAKTALLKVITAGSGFAGATGNYGYDLFPNFANASQPVAKNGIEHIFSAQFDGTAGGFASEQNLSSFTWSNSAYTSDIPSDSTVIVNLFNIADQRRTVTFYDSLYNQTTGAWVHWPFFNFLKFVDQSGGINGSLPGAQGVNSKANFPIIRYSDILLLYAEVLNELNGGPTSDAYNAINIVRARAYAAPGTFIPETNTYSSYNYTGNGNYTNHAFDLSGLSQLEFRDSVFTERRREFIQESQRWFDLVRRAPDAEYGSGQYYLQSVHNMLGNPKAAATLNDTIFPIPQSEINLYGTSNPNFQQNSGW